MIEATEPDLKKPVVDSARITTPLLEITLSDRIIKCYEDECQGVSGQIKQKSVFRLCLP